MKELDEVRRKFGHLALLRVWPEWESSGVWMPPAIGSIPVGGNVELRGLPISSVLKDRLVAWQDDFNRREPWETPEPGCRSAHDAEGLDIAIALSKEIGEQTLVEFDIGIGSAFALFQNGTCVGVYRYENKA